MLSGPSETSLWDSNNFIKKFQRRSISKNCWIDTSNTLLQVLIFNTELKTHQFICHRLKSMLLVH